MAAAISAFAVQPIKMPTVALVPSAQQFIRMRGCSTHHSPNLIPADRWCCSQTPHFSNNRGAVFLHSHSREESVLDKSLRSQDVVDSSLHLMEMEYNSTSDTDFALQPSTSSELWGMPIQSIILLNLVAVIWGTQHSVIKTVVDENTISIGADFFHWIEDMGINMGTLQTSSGGNDIVAGGDGSGAAYFTLARFGLAALLASPYTPGLRLWVDDIKENIGVIESTTLFDDDVDAQGEEKSTQTIEKDTSQSNSREFDDRGESISLAWKYGAELGLYMFLGYAFQAIGLETTTASRSGFLLYLNVKFVPFLSYFIFGKTIQRNTWISALIAFGGTALLAFDNANASGSTENGLEMAFSVGDLWSIAAAAASAIFILRMEAASKAVPKSSELNSANLWTVAALSLLWTIGISWNNNHFGADTASEFAHAMQQTLQKTLSTITSHPVALIYLSGVTTALANFLQSKAQKDVSAERASVIYAMDPVYGAIFANILLGETLGGLGLAGAGLITVAAATNALMDFGSVSSDEVVAVDKESDGG